MLCRRQLRSSATQRLDILPRVSSLWVTVHFLSQPRGCGTVNLMTSQPWPQWLTVVVVKTHLFLISFPELYVDFNSLLSMFEVTYLNYDYSYNLQITDCRNKNNAYRKSCLVGQRSLINTIVLLSLGGFWFPAQREFPYRLVRYLYEIYILNGLLFFWYLSSCAGM